MLRMDKNWWGPISFVGGFLAYKCCQDWMLFFIFLLFFSFIFVMMKMQCPFLFLSVVWPIPKFTCLFLWDPSMCGFSCSRCMFRICHKVIANDTGWSKASYCPLLLFFSCVPTNSVNNNRSKDLYIDFLLPGTPNNGGAWTSCSIVYGNEFSARLSVGSILRLRGATLTALSEDTTTDTAVIFRLARRLLHLSRYRGSKNKEKGPGLDIHPGAATAEGISHIHGSQHMNNTEGIPHPHNLLWAENSLVTFAIVRMKVTPYMIYWAEQFDFHCREQDTGSRYFTLDRGWHEK